MSKVDIKNITKYYGDVLAVDNVSIEIEKGELIGLLGPSGCGKTTLLRVMSGFLKPNGGSIFMGGNDVTELPPEKRPTSLVFQNYALFPHLTVFENIAFGLKVKKVPMEQIRKDVKEILKVIDLEGIEDRSVSQLSGGQQQRIALARGLVMKPEVLLLDEPLCNLDAKLRVETRDHIKRIQQSLGITSVFVTHDQEEALSICDRIVIMKDGKVLQIGTPEEIYGKPTSKFAADFIGKSNLLNGKIDQDEKDLNAFVLESGQKVLVENKDAYSGNGNVLIRPENISISNEAKTDASVNCLEGEVDYITYLGEVTYYRVAISKGVQILTSIYGKCERSWKVGSKVFISWNPSDALLIKE
ncbi:ABC transporter ATP-binding protein [Clostridia bacterium]|nr:ABC transporter ATP-binding protein [Clostridia bacterium]